MEQNHSIEPGSPAARRTCDVVMKGGITSGVVYPRAISRLAEQYDFKNIGGTSAGAIAAAIAAAAQYRRSVGKSEEGFKKLADLPKELGDKVGDDGKTRLFTFFQPDTKTEPVFAVVTAALGGGGGAVGRVILAATENYPTWTGLGGLPGALLFVASLTQLGTGVVAWAWLAVSIGLAVVGGVLGAFLGFLRDVFIKLPENFYGICRGVNDGPAAGKEPPLTEWLDVYLNETAGLKPGDGPLTFGHLWGATEASEHPELRLINLEMMTTNISHGRPYRLPFRDDEDLHENHFFYFRKDEMLKFFPASVVEHMVKTPRSHGNDPERMKRRERLADLGLFPMPAPSDLPVVVATRMSLSFPILLSAVPLHWIHPADRLHGIPERCWFSDGGLCSNFPLHFFDTALPRRPTFSIDLTEKPKDTPKERLVPDMDEDNQPAIRERWNRFDAGMPTHCGIAPATKPTAERLPGFVAALIKTMQNWTDSTQGRLPGYRDRIVRVPLVAEEGGLNLNMPSELIKELTERGEAAAGMLLHHFGPPPNHPVMNWDNHRWIRLRAYLASLEKSLEQLEKSCARPEAGDKPYPAWLEDIQAGKARMPSYPMSAAQLAAARKTLAELRAILLNWKAVAASEDAPRPRPVLRPRAQI